MTTAIKRRRGSTVQHSTFTGLAAEITIDTDKNTVVVHNGAQAGGFPLAKESGSALSPSTVTLTSGTANGVAYLNGSKVLTSGSALTFDGANLATGRLLSGRYTSDANGWGIQNYATSAYGSGFQMVYGGVGAAAMWVPAASSLAFGADAGAGTTEQMRLTSTGLGVGTSSPSYPLVVSKADTSSTIGGSGASLHILNTDSAAYGRLSELVFNLVNQASTSAMASVSAQYATYGGSYGGNLLFSTNAGSGGSVTERMRLDASGNLGLGVTPSAWGSNRKAIDFENYSCIASSVGAYYGLELGNNFYNNAGYKYKVSSQPASLYQTYNGGHYWYTAPSGTAGNAISFTQAMTLDASGNLTVSNTTAGSGVSANVTNLSSASSSQAEVRVTQGAVVSVLNSYNNSNAFIGTVSNHPSAFITNNTERMRIDSSGNLLVGTASQFGSGKQCIYFDGASFNGLSLQTTKATTGSNYLAFYNSATTNTGSISQNGTTTVAYTTSSDYRLKENIQPMQGALGVVAQLNPVTYTWKVDGSDGQGFIAHELQAVVPDCVTGEKDAEDAEGKPVYQGIDTSFLVATLTKAIQEQQEQINQLKAEVAALKGN